MLKEHDVLIRNHATVVSAAECTARGGKDPAARLYFGLTRPRFPVLGTSFAGEVHAVGSAVTRYRVGDQVMGSVGPTLGAHAEYVRVSEDGVIARKPANLSWTDAVAIFDGGLTALPFLRDSARLTRGQSILINGASGAVGTAAVQLAKHLGAAVTAVTSSANLELVKSLGADEAIDYTVEDFTKSGRLYDVVFDAVGKSSYTRSRKLLKPGGIYLTTVPSLPILLQMLWTSKIGKTKAAIAFTGLRKAPPWPKTWRTWASWRPPESTCPSSTSSTPWSRLRLRTPTSKPDGKGEVSSSPWPMQHESRGVRPAAPTARSAVPRDRGCERSSHSPLCPTRAGVRRRCPPPPASRPAHPAP